MFLHLSVSHSVHGGGCIPACIWADTPPGDIPRPVHAGIYTHPCPVHAGIHTHTCPVHAGIHPAADGTHPTGMHTCRVVLLWKIISPFPAV